MVKPDLRKLTRDGGSDPENLGSFGCCGGGECSLLILAEAPVFWPCALLAVYQLSGASVFCKILPSPMSFGAGMISCTLYVITFPAFSDIQ